jgi:PAS domain-containing protein
LISERAQEFIFNLLPLNSFFSTTNIFYPLIWILCLVSLILLWLVFEQRRNYHQSKKTAEHYRSLLDDSPSAMLIFQDYKLKYANEALEQLTGFSRQQLLSMEIWQLIHPKSLSDLNSDKWAIRGNNNSMRIEVPDKNLRRASYLG